MSTEEKHGTLYADYRGETNPNMNQIGGQMEVITRKTTGMVAMAKVERSVQKGPGPSAYRLKSTLGTQDVCLSKSWAPAYSIGYKKDALYNDSPGPVYNFDPFLTNRGKKDRPSYSLQSRPPLKGIEVSPGPGNYNTEQVKAGSLSTEKKAPSIGIGMRTRWSFKNESPPSNKYNKPSTLGTCNPIFRGAPAWAQKGRQEVGSTYYNRRKENVPGPGAYSTLDPNAYKRKSGVYSMQGRTQVKDYNTAKQNPAPGAYYLPTPRKSGFSMGERHSAYITPLILESDICY